VKLDRAESLVFYSS